ncbi:Uncharacterised protein [Candidatus Burarchaeum australiense]|nr:Uncharacterised protein [Candidatus Burarchaeum australiense]
MVLSPSANSASSVNSLRPQLSEQFRASRATDDIAYNLNVCARVIELLVPSLKPDRRVTIIPVNARDFERARSILKSQEAHGARHADKRRKAGHEIDSEKGHEKDTDKSAADISSVLTPAAPRDWDVGSARVGNSIRYRLKSSLSNVLWCTRGYETRDAPKLSQQDWEARVKAEKAAIEEISDSQLRQALAAREQVGNAVWNVICNSVGVTREALDAQLAEIARLWALTRYFRSSRRRFIPVGLPDPKKLVRYKPEEVEKWLEITQQSSNTMAQENRTKQTIIMERFSEQTWPESISEDVLARLVADFGLRKQLQQYMLFEANNLFEPSLSFTRPQLLAMLEESLRLIEHKRGNNGPLEGAKTQSAALIGLMDDFEKAVRELHVMASDRISLKDGQKAAELLYSVMQQRSKLLKNSYELYSTIDKLGKEPEVEGALRIIEGLFENLCQGNFADRITALNKLFSMPSKILKKHQTDERYARAKKKTPPPLPPGLANFMGINDVLVEYLKHLEELGNMKMRPERRMHRAVKEYSRQLQKQLEEKIDALPPILKHCCRAIVLYDAWRHSVYKQDLPQKWDLRTHLTPERLLFTMLELASVPGITGKRSDILIDKSLLWPVLPGAVERKETSLLSGGDETVLGKDGVAEKWPETRVPIDDALGHVVSLLDSLITHNSYVYESLRNTPYEGKSLLDHVLAEVQARAGRKDNSLMDLYFGPLFAFAHEDRLYMWYKEETIFREDPKNHERRPWLKTTVYRVALEDPTDKKNLLPEPLFFWRPLDEPPAEWPSPPRLPLEEELYGQRASVSQVLGNELKYDGANGYRSLGSRLLEGMNEFVRFKWLLENEPGFRDRYYMADALFASESSPLSGVITLMQDGKPNHKLPFLLTGDESETLSLRASRGAEKQIRNHLDLAADLDIFMRYNVEVAGHLQELIGLMDKKDADGRV